MKNKKGFTLIELMIVVAIIGILAALAIPDFMKMLAKSKQSEAKTNLGAIFTGQVSYHGEHNTYVSEQNVEEDWSNEAINHPLIAELFTDFVDGKYVVNWVTN